MNSSKIISFLLVVNLALIALVAYLFKTRSDSAPLALPIQAAASGAVTNKPRVIIKGTAPRVITVTNDFQWAQLETEDYREYIERLRSIGCPEQTIRDIVIADLDKLLAPQVQSIYGRRTNLQYWHSEEEELANDQDHRKWIEKEKEIDREKRAIILELLGVDLVRERMKLKGVQDCYERRLGFLPEAKRTKVRLLLDEFDEAAAPLRSTTRDAAPSLTEENELQLAQLQAERDAELAPLLSPAELRQYELWMSPTADAVRYAFYGMDATENEFLSVYALRKTFDEQWNPAAVNLSDDAQLTAWAEAKQELDQSIRESLGEERYREYERGQDVDWHRLNATVTRYELPREVATEVYEMKHTLQEMRSYVESDPNLSQEQKATAVNEMVFQTQHAVKQALGEKGFQYFQSGGNGQWLR